MAEASGAFNRDQQHSLYGLDLLHYEKVLNGKVRITVAFPVEHKSKVDKSAVRKVKWILETMLKCHVPLTGNLKKYMDRCKDEVSAGKSLLRQSLSYFTKIS